MAKKPPYTDFTERLRLFAEKRPELLLITLSNIFTMRLIGNKTHGDLAEIAVAEFINQYMYDFKSVHVGKDLFRAKKGEEDIRVINELTQECFPVSLKAYGNGPLQLSTDKNSRMFPRLEKTKKGVAGRAQIAKLLKDGAFSAFYQSNILPLIYDEKRKKCNIMVFNFELARQNTARIARVEAGGGRKHPVYVFTDKNGGYICEVRYGGKTANALQRGLWTHTEKGAKYFNSITGGWVDYSHNKVLVRLFSHALVSSEAGHTDALKIIKSDIGKLRKKGAKSP